MSTTQIEKTGTNGSSPKEITPLRIYALLQFKDSDRIDSSNPSGLVAHYFGGSWGSNGQNTALVVIPDEHAGVFVKKGWRYVTFTAKATDTVTRDAVLVTRENTIDALVTDLQEQLDLIRSFRRLTKMVD